MEGGGDPTAMHFRTKSPVASAVIETGRGVSRSIH